MRAIFLRFLIISQTSTCVQKSLLMNGSTLFLHKHVYQNNSDRKQGHNLFLFQTSTLLYLTGLAACRCHHHYLFCWSCCITSHSPLNRATAGLLFCLHVTLENLGFNNTYSIEKYSLVSPHKFLFFSVSASCWYSCVPSSWFSDFILKMFLIIPVHMLFSVLGHWQSFLAVWATSNMSALLLQKFVLYLDHSSPLSLFLCLQLHRSLRCACSSIFINKF